MLTLKRTKFFSIEYVVFISFDIRLSLFIPNRETMICVRKRNKYKNCSNRMHILAADKKKYNQTAKIFEYWPLFSVHVYCQHHQIDIVNHQFVTAKNVAWKECSGAVPRSHFFFFLVISPATSDQVISFTWLTKMIDDQKNSNLCRE